MKKRFVLALVAAAMFSAPIAQAGFSSKPSSSPSRPAPAVSKPAAQTYKPAAPVAAPAPAYKPAAAPAKPTNYGSMSGFGSVKKDEPKQAAAPVTPAPVSGFSAAPKDQQAQGSTVGKKVAGVAAATALGGALYAASANHDAVAAYEAPAHKAESTDSSKMAQAEAVKTDKAPVTPAKSVPDTVAATHAPVNSQPQVVVIQQEAPRYRHDSHDDAYWYQRGRDSAYRDQPIAGGTYSMPAPATVTQHTQSSPAMVEPIVKPGSMIGLLAVVLFLALLLGAVYYWSQRSHEKAAKPATRKSNYTL